VTISRFVGEHRFLSNFYPVAVELDGNSYASVEHAYQAAKTLDPDLRKHIRMAESAHEAKAMGRVVKLRDDWEEIKLVVMTDLVTQKFTRHRWLRKWLLDTGEHELIEGNTWGDTFWGVCGGHGENRLGRILMNVRSSLKP
jgi:ribA/ribD-fused uncharacterized protein